MTTRCRKTGSISSSRSLRRQQAMRSIYGLNEPRFPSNSRHPAYFVPSAFVLYAALLVAMHLGLALFGSHAGACVWRAAAIASVPMLVYAFLTAASVFSLNPASWAITWYGVVATHFVYGVRFMQGIMAKRAPCEFIGKDHA